MSASLRGDELAALREDFPLLRRVIEGRPVIYLDSAATALKPRQVLEAIARFYQHHTANIHRGDHSLSQESSDAYESARGRVARFLNATAGEIAFTSNTTDGVNLVASALRLGRGDNVVASVMEHHSNLLPWLDRCELRLLDEAPDGRFDVSQLADRIDAHTRLVALGHVSNVTGAIQPIEAAIEAAHARGVPVLIDGAQSVPHLPVDVVGLRCDFLAFSAHKMLGPSGVGVLYVAESMWDRLGTFKTGGGMVHQVKADRFSPKRYPHRFEAGTPNIEGVLGLAAAIEYLEQVGMDRVAAHDAELARLMLSLFSELPGATLLGPAEAAHRIAIASLVPPPGIEASTVGMMLSDSFKIMARAGTHCAHPYFDAHGAAGSVRLSSYLYNTEEEIRAAHAALVDILSRLAPRRS